MVFRAGRMFYYTDADCAARAWQAAQARRMVWLVISARPVCFGFYELIRSLLAPSRAVGPDMRSLVL